MKNVLFLYLCFLTISCQKDDDIKNVVLSSDTITFNYNGKDVKFTEFKTSSITEGQNGPVVGKRISGYSYYPEASTVTNFEIDLDFYTTSNRYELYGASVSVSEKLAGYDGYVTTLYSNFFANGILNFNNDIQLKGNYLEGSFSGDLTDNGGSYISISEGYINFEVQ